MEKIFFCQRPKIKSSNYSPYHLQGPLNTYARAGKLFPGPHLYAGAGLVCLWALAAACVPAMQKGNDTARYVDQGGGKRKGAFAIYLEPWHADVQDFLDLKKNHGKEEMRARDLFYALWIPDLFMQRVEEGGEWFKCSLGIWLTCDL